MTEEKTLIEEEINKIVKLTGIWVSQGDISLKEKIRVLKMAGFEDYQVSNILNKPLVIVRVLQ